MKLRCDECEQVTEHCFVGVSAEGCQLHECGHCHQRVWIKVEGALR